MLMAVAVGEDWDQDYPRCHLVAGIIVISPNSKYAGVQDRLHHYHSEAFFRSSMIGERART